MRRARRGFLLAVLSLCASLCACGTTLDLGERPGSTGDGGDGALADGAVADAAASHIDGASAFDGGSPSTVDGSGGATDASGGGGCGGGPCHVFVTSTQYAADFGGIASGDAKCVLAAMTAGLPRANRYKIYLSDGSAAAWSRFTSSGPWRLMGTNLLLFPDPLALRVNNDLTIDRDESGQQALGAQYWTGAGTQGNPGDNCLGFTSTDLMKQGAVGGWPHWIDLFSAACDTLPKHLLCLED